MKKRAMPQSKVKRSSESPVAPSPPPGPPPPPPANVPARKNSNLLNSVSGRISSKAGANISEENVVETEEIQKLKIEKGPLLKQAKKKMKKAKSDNPSALTESLMLQAQSTVQNVEGDYMGAVLSDIKKFDKRALKQKNSLVDDFDFDLEDDDESEPIRVKRKPYTLDLKLLYLNYCSGENIDYPVDKFQYIVLQIDAKANTTLNFSGVATLNDLVLALAFDLRKKEESRFNSVISIVLDGCHQITDAGINWMAQAFPQLKMLSLVGCIHITDASFFSLSEHCPDLRSIDLSGTNVNFLPKRWVDAEGIRMTCCPILYPLAPADIKEKKGKQAPLKSDGKDLFNVSILHLGAPEVSVLAALKGQKQPSSQGDLPSVQHCDCFAVDSDLMASVSEANQTLSNLFVSDRSVVVIPSTLKDKTKIHDEAASIASTIISIITKHKGAKFVIVGCNSDSQGVVPTNLIHEEVISYAKKIALTIRERHPVFSSNSTPATVEKMTFSKQLVVSRAVNLLPLLENLDTCVTGMEINVDKDCKGLVAAISKSAKSLGHLKHVTYDKDIWDWASSFDKKCPKTLKSGIHSLSNAADAMASGFNLKERLRSFGAVHFLNHVGQLCLWQNSDKEVMVANRSWLCQVINSLLSGNQKGVKNNGQNHTIADDCLVWPIEQLREDSKQQGLDMNEVESVIKEFPNLFIMGQTTVTSWSKLPESSIMDVDIFTAFDKGTSKYDCLHAMYNFVMDQTLTPTLLHNILQLACKLYVPVHLWQTGVIINDGLVAVLIGQTGYSKLLNVCAYIPKNHDSEDKLFSKLIWNTIEKYKVMIQYCFAAAGIDYEQICRASDQLFPIPDKVAGVVHGHSLKSDSEGMCGKCGLPSSEAAMLSNFNQTISPEVLGTESMSKAELKANIAGSVIEIQGPGTTQVKCNISPLGSRWCGVSLIQGNARLLNFSFKCQQSSSSFVCLNLKDNAVHWSVNGEAGKVDVSKKLQLGTLQGSVVWGHLSYQTTWQFSVYMGPLLLHTVEVPYGSYSLVIDATNFSETGNSATLTVHSTDFLRGSRIISTNMRLEALDRLTPNLVCAATIQEIKDNQVLIHFDGWTDRYDYWTEFDSKDLHPIGYMAHRNGRPSNGKRVNKELQPPKGYSKAFTWLTYLQDEKAEPVPYHLFAEHQLEGCPSDETDSVADALGIMTLDPSQVSCSSSLERSVYYSFMMKNIAAAAQQGNNFRQEMNDDKELGIFPFCFLPTEMSLQSLRYPVINNILSDKKNSVHLLCEGQGMEFHLVNYRGIPLSKMNIGSLHDWSGQEVMAFYLMLSFQKNVLPPDPSEFIQGSKEIARLKPEQLEMGLKRLFRIYIFRSLVMMNHQVQTKTKPDKSLKTKNGQAFSSSIKDKLNSDPEFSKFFSFTQDSYLCQAHKMADSPNLGITEINIETFQGLAPKVYSFNLNSNPLTSIPPDFFTHFHNVTQLFLEKCNLTELPPFSQNCYLEEIYVKGNKLTALPDDIKQLTYLKILHISNNPLEGLPPSVSSLKALTNLAADNIGNVDLAVICTLTGLQYLSISFNLIEDIPDTLASLPLQTLYMAGLPFMTSRETFSSTTVSNFMEEIVVYRRIPKEEQMAMVQKIETSGETANSAKIAMFNKLLVEKYPRIGTMKKQKDGVISPAIFKLKDIQKLHLSNHVFTSVPDSMVELKQVVSLNFDSNPRLENVSAELARLPLKELHLRDCPSLKTPPKEVVRRGFLAVFGYLKRLLQGSVPCKRTKLMMVGLGGAGKTSLVRALTKKNFNFYEDYGEQITDGIDITEWLVDTRKVPGIVDTNSQEPLHFSVWDFAGQTVYYNTHQFFLSNRAVYLLLWNTRLGFEHAGLDFWLSSIACHAPKAPILVVGTHCDKVKKGKLPFDELKRRYPQIHGFHFVSSYSGEGIDELKLTLLKSALEQKYMGEKIPEAWISLETGLNTLRKEKESLVPWARVEDVANTTGIFDAVELIQAVQFLHDLGSVQFFNTSFLRSHVVIVPQWIVDVMACIVTVHEGPIKEGKLLYSDMVTVWKDYPKELHPWLLRLTEEFDLTFPISNEEANIVPCLLPNGAPEYEFAPLKKDKQEREALMIYRFEYLPAGLFNRAQVRLHQFSDSAVMWKKGFMLKKNNHRALLLQVSNTEVEVTARGFKPENTLFLVHEVFECLIADSYSGVSYDFSIPCSECADDITLDPSMFSASKIKRAFDMKAPFLQCDRNFHIISIPEIQAVMPPDKNSDFDEHLGRSVRELQDLEKGVAIKVLFIYTQRNIPDLANEGKVVDPTHLLDDLRKIGFNVSYCDDPETANMESMTLAIKSAQIVVIGISDDFILNDQCKNLIIYTKQTLKKTIILATLGSTLSWQKNDINIVLADEVFVKMTDAKRYPAKLKEIEDAIKTRVSKKKADVYPECFISYCWSNSKNAVDLGSSKIENALGWADPRKIKDFLQEKGINCWLDINQMGQEGFFEDIADGLRKAKMMVACVSDEYAMSKNCKMEFRFALSTLKIPTVLAVVGTGYNWERSEIGLLTVGHSNNCPKINLQYENEPGMLDLLKAVQAFLPKSEGQSSSDNYTTEQHQNVAFQEVLELTQRKLLRHISMYSENMDSEPYPRLLIVDLKGRKEDANSRRPKTGRSKPEEKKEETRDEASEEKKDGEERAASPKKQSEVIDEVSVIGEELEDERVKSDTYCFRILCEHEQGWHESPEAISFPSKDGEALDNFLRSVSPYLVRVMAILKHTKLSLPILTTPKGEKLRRNMEEWCTRTNSDFQSEYSMMLENVLDEDINRTYGGLKKCYMPNGKSLWLCPKHERFSFTQTEEKYKDQINNVVPGQPANGTEAEETDSETATLDGSNTIDGEAPSTPPAMDPTAVKEQAPRHRSVTVQPAKGASLPPRRPKLSRSPSVRKTTSQACRVM